MSMHVLLWVHRVEAKRVQKSALNDMKEVKGFDFVRQNLQKQDHATPRMPKKRTDVDTVAQGTHSGSALHMAKNIASVGSKSTPRQLAN